MQKKTKKGAIKKGAILVLVIFFVIVGFFLFCLFLNDAHGAGVNPLGGIGARGRGMAAGIAVADDASAFYYNPALLAETGNFGEVGVGLEYIRANFTYKTPDGKKYDSDTGEYFVPIIGTNHHINDLTVGIGIVTPFTFGADFKDQLGFFSKISLTEIAPAVAYRVSDKLSIGGAVKIGRGEIELSQPTLAGRLDSQSDGWGYAGQLGLLWKPTKWLRLGTTYQSKIKVELDGRAKFATGGASSNFSTDFYFPGYYGIGGAVDIGDFLIAADVMRFDYSSTDQANIKYKKWPANTLKLNWQNNTYYGTGVEWKADKNWRLRTGLAYQGAVIPASTISPATPDMDGWCWGIGGGYRGKKLSADLTYLHAWGPERKINPPNPEAGKYKASIDIISASLTYRW